jgi:hypothetical protein
MKNTNEKPILFSASMIRAILDGKKTQTRRIVKPQPPQWAGVPSLVVGEWVAIEGVHPVGECESVNCSHLQHRESTYSIKCPFGKIGDSLWVRETWGVASIYDPVKPSDLEPNGMKVSYFATDSHEGVKGRPSIFMPRWASRINLEITGIRVERLQDISEADALAEGITYALAEDLLSGGVVNYDEPAHFTPYRYKWGYKQLWNQINGENAWAENPFVWCISFEVTK